MTWIRSGRWIEKINIIYNKIYRLDLYPEVLLDPFEEFVSVQQHHIFGRSARLTYDLVRGAGL
ncbi:MAG: hypothetical protein ACQES8_09830, partial [Thermodesulfobacteriota bacterium]